MHKGEPDIDDMEYLAYNTTDDEDNNSLDLSSVPASTMDGDNSDDVETDNKSTDNGEDHTQASRLYQDLNDDKEDEDYAEISQTKSFINILEYFEKANQREQQKAKRIHRQKVNVTGVVTGVVTRVVKGVVMGVVMRVVKGVVTGRCAKSGKSATKGQEEKQELAAQVPAAPVV
ncbi:hypothetical protein BGX38DRAFT_1280838 [Terfezia claveryi]|nr:hypothetical protein BGX38DRAFT_1280838 [Terfezia claveryi]